MSLLRLYLKAFYEGQILTVEGKEFHSRDVFSKKELFYKVVLDLGIWRSFPCLRFLWLT